MWARKRTVSMECPKSYVTSQSLTWIDEFAFWRRHAAADYAGMEAKKLDAFLTLEAQLAAENNEHRE